MDDSTPERDKAWGLQDRYNAAAQAVRDNPDLTVEARQRQLAELWATIRRRLDDLQAEERTRLEDSWETLTRKLFNLSIGSLDGATAAISARDAQDRAARLTTPDEAAELLHRAEMGRDKVLAGAVAHLAAERADSAVMPNESEAWTQVLRAYVDARPDSAPVVSELAAIERLNQRDLVGPFSLPAPHGVSNLVINTARAAAAGQEPPAAVA